MKNLKPFRNQILFGMLIVFLGLSKSWFMTAEPLTDINLASDATSSAPTSSAPSSAPAPVVIPDTTKTDTTTDTTSDDDQPATPPKKKIEASRASTTTTSKLGNVPEAKPKYTNTASTTGNTAACRGKTGTALTQCQQAQTKKIAAGKKPPTISGSHGGGMQAAAAKKEAAKDAAPDSVAVKGKDQTGGAITDAQAQQVVAKTGGKIVNQTWEGKSGSTTVDYTVTGIETRTIMTDVVTKDGYSQVASTELVATIHCSECDDTDIVETTATDNAGVIKDIMNKIHDKAKLADAKKKTDAKEKVAEDKCEKDSDGKRLSEEDQLTCLAHRDATDDSNPRDRVDNLRADVEDEVMDNCQDGPEGLSECKRELRAIRAEVGGDRASKQYIDKFMKFANSYGQETNLARQMALSPSPQMRQYYASQIAQIEQPYMYDAGHSAGTQSYLDDFRGVLLNYGQQATLNPYGAYNNFFNGGTGAAGNSLLGSNANSIFGNGLNGLNGLNANAPAGFQYSGTGPGGMVGAPAGYSGINNSLLNSTVPFNLRQSVRTQGAPGYVPGGTQGLPAFSS